MPIGKGDNLALRTRIEQALKRRLIVKLGCISNQKFHLDSFMVAPRTDVERIGLYSDLVQTSCVLPVDGSELIQQYRPRYVYRLSKATADPMSGLIYDEQGQFIAESSSWNQLRQLWSWPKPYIKPPTRRLAGTYVFLPKIGYYHWLLEELPPLIAALKNCPDATVLVPAGAPSYAEDFLRLLGSPVVYIDRPTAVETLIMVGKTAGHGLSPHPTDVSVLRDFFSAWMSTEAPTKKLYLSRVGQRRSPPNEIDLLRVASENGYEIFEGAKTDLLTQVRLFSEASEVIGIHGAALTNLVFSRQARVCELFSAGYLPACYSILASHAGLAYQCLVYDRQEPGVIDDRGFELAEQFIRSSSTSARTRQRSGTYTDEVKI